MIVVNEKIASKHSDGAATRNRYYLVGLDVDDATLAQMLGISRRDCKLALEHGRSDTSTERRREIIGEIESLRSVREALIVEWRKC